MKKQLILKELRDLRKNCTYENANFGEQDKFIKEQTKMHRETWIIPKIDEIISEIEK